MAIINFKEMIEVIKSHPDYMSKWEKGADASITLVIDFVEDALAADGDPTGGDVFETPDGINLFTDMDKQGKLISIEIT